MNKSLRKTAADQFEFGFVMSSEIRWQPPLKERSSCVTFVPEPKTVRPWVPVFADRPPGDHRFFPKYHRPIR